MNRAPAANTGFYASETLALESVVARIVDQLDPEYIWLFGHVLKAVQDRTAISIFSQPAMGPYAAPTYQLRASPRRSLQPDRPKTQMRLPEWQTPPSTPGGIT